MRKRIPTQLLFTALTATAAALFSGACSIPQIAPAGTHPPHAFISYNPVPEGEEVLTLAVKDLIDVEGQLTTAGSHYLKDNAKPATADAKCLEIARERGVHLIGKTNLSEFAAGVSGANSYFGTPQNPVRGKRNRMPGGSSSGSAIAIAEGLADIALGTDSGGSIRVPAACCGIVGLKTTFGLVSLEGVRPISPEHLDTVGPMAMDVAGVVTGMGLLQRGFEDLYEKAKQEHPTPDSLRIGRLYVPGTHPAIDNSIDEAFEKKGFTLYPMDPKFLEAWQKAEHYGNIVAATGAWRSNKHLMNHLTVGARAKAVLLLGQVHSLTTYNHAINQKAKWQEMLRDALREVDAIALPVLKSPPLKMAIATPPAIYEARVLSIQNTVAVNFAGNPALAVPVLLKKGHFPVTSVQFIGPPNSEAMLLNIGRLME